MTPVQVAALFAEKAVLYGPSVVSTVKAIWQTIQGEHPELRTQDPGPLDAVAEARRAALAAARASDADEERR